MPMTLIPEAGTVNLLHFSGAGFWYVCHVNSGTGFIWYQILVRIKTLFCSKPESGVHVTEMIIYDLFPFRKWSRFMALVLDGVSWV